MKNLFIILITFALTGCATIKPTFNHHKAPEVYIDPDYTWANNYTTNVMFGQRSDLRSITLRVINKKYCDVKVKVRCEFPSHKYGANIGDPNVILFGESERVVKARNDKTFMVYGFARMTPDNETVSCFIKSVK